MSFSKDIGLISFKFIGAIAAVGTGVLLVSSSVKKIVGGIGKIMWNIGKMGLSIVTMPFKLLKRFAALLNPITLVMTLIKSKILMVVATVGLIILGLYLAFKYIKKLLPWIWDKLLKFGAWIWEQLPTWISKLFEWAKDLWVWLKPKLIEFGQWIWS